MPNEEWIWWNLHFSNRPCSALIVCKNSHCALSHVYLFLFASRSLKRLEMSVKYVGTCTSSNTCGLKLIKGNPMGFFLFCNAMFWWTGSCGVCISYSSSTSINAHIHSTNAWGAVIFCGGNVTKEVAVKKRKIQTLATWGEMQHHDILSLHSIDTAILILLLVLFWSPPTPETNIWLFIS